jgi:hypothetical protein
MSPSLAGRSTYTSIDTFLTKWKDTKNQTSSKEFMADFARTLESLVNSDLGKDIE